jgi:hypothetical protein
VKRRIRRRDEGGKGFGEEQKWRVRGDDGKSRRTRTNRRRKVEGEEG